MRLNTNKTFVKAGDIIEISWDSEEGNSSRLVLHTGNKQNVLNVPLAGTKKFRMKSSKGRHSISLISNVYGKDRKITKRIFVYGKVKETDEFEYVDRGDASPINRWNSSIQQWWQNFTAEKKRLYVILLLLLAYNAMNASQSLHDISTLIFYGTIFWIFWIIIKK